MIHLPRILAAAGEIQAFCQKQGWRFCFIGGVAVQRWGEPRLTQDVDLTLELKGAIEAMARLEQMVAKVERRVRANP
jgi:hypothetical protein